MHPSLFVTRFGETDNSYRLSWVKHKINNAVKQEKSAFYRVFLLFIELINFNYLIYSFLIKVQEFQIFTIKLLVN